MATSASIAQRKSPRQTKHDATITPEREAKPESKSEAERMTAHTTQNSHGAHAASVARRQGAGWLSWEEARRTLGVSTGRMTKLLAKGGSAGGLDAYRSPCDERIKLVKRADVERLLRDARPSHEPPATAG